MMTVAETGPYQRKISSLRSPEERSDLVTYLAEYPNSGVVIQGSGGIRKLRWACQGGGKSGGVRIIYYFHSEMMPLYLLAAFGKNEKANISNAEKHSLSKAVKDLVTYWRLRNEQGIH